MATKSGSSVDISHISGNASNEIKERLGNIPTIFAGRRPAGFTGELFGESIQNRLKITEISINKKAEEERKTEGRVVIEVDVAEDMLNGGGNIHGGCSAFLLDVCSTIALMALSLSSTGKLSPGVSQSMNLIYHSPATTGDKLRLVNTTLTQGARAMSVRTEIWNVTHHRLVVSGTHIKMNPSAPKPNL